ncbi:MAG: hypothetical protein ACRD2N_18410, partial [Vicinamibacterales bacterium]
GLWGHGLRARCPPIGEELTPPKAFVEFLMRDWTSIPVEHIAEGPPGRTHPTFVELGTNRPLYVHRTGSNVVNGRYFVDSNPTGTIAHYSSFRRIDVAGLRKMHEEAKATPPEEVVKTSPLKLGAGLVLTERYFTVSASSGSNTAKVIADLNPQGYWLAPLFNNTHPYTRDGSSTPAPGDFSQTYVGDETDTSPYQDDKIMGISIDAYIRNVGALIRALGAPK